jgi:hypothetical protein
MRDVRATANFLSKITNSKAEQILGMGKPMKRDFENESFEFAKKPSAGGQ